MKALFNKARRNSRRPRFQHGWVEPVGKIEKKWKGHYYVYVREPDGSERRAHKSVDLGLRSRWTKGQAQKLLRELIDQLAQQKAEPERHTVRWFWDTRFLPMREPSWKESSKREMVANVERYVLARFGDVPLAEVERFDVQMHLNALAEKYSGSVVEKARVWVRAILEEAVDQRFIQINPAKKLSIPQTKKACKRVLTTEEIVRLMAELLPRDQLLIRLCLILGLRPGEALALRWNDIQGGTVRVDEGMVDGRIFSPKTEASIADIAVPETLAAELAELRAAVNPASGEEFVFPNSTGGVMRLDNFRHRVLGPAAERAGIEGVTFQSLRRTCATFMAGVAGTVKDVQAHMRHAQVSTTFNVYAQPVAASVRAAVGALDAALFPCGGEEISKGEINGSL